MSQPCNTNGRMHVKAEDKELAINAAEPDLPSRHSIVLVVDLVESVRLMQIDEKGLISRWRAFNEHVRHVLLPATAGRLVKSLGDGLMAEFSNAGQAVQAAAAMHDWMSTQCSPLCNFERLYLRVGVHATPVFDLESDIQGIGVNLTSRIAALAAPGETVATVEVRDLLRDPIEADIDDLGDCHLKHVARPVRAFRLGPPRPPERAFPQESYTTQLHASVAILPFANATDADRFGGIGDMVADGLINRLSLSPGLHIVSRLSTAALRGRDMNFGQIAQLLGVRYVVSGVFAILDDRLTISAELAGTATGETLWSGRVRGDWRDLLQIHSELLHEIADSIHRKLLESAVARATTHPLPALRSYELLLAGISMMHRTHPADFERSRKLLEALAERHPRTAQPHAWLGKWYVLRTIQGDIADPSDAASMALDHTRRALELEPASALAMAIEGFVYGHLKRDVAGADARLLEACTLNPSEGFAWLFLAVMQAFQGRSGEALDYARRALALSPIDPLRYYYESLMASCELSAGHHAEAIALCERSRRRNRLHLSTMRVLIAAHVAAGNDAQARAVAADLLRVKPGYTVEAYERQSVAALYPFGRQIAQAMRSAGVP